MQTPAHALLPFALLSLTLTACASTSQRTDSPAKSVRQTQVTEPTTSEAKADPVTREPITIVEEEPADDGPTMAEAPPIVEDEGPYGLPVASDEQAEQAEQAERDVTQISFDAVQFRTDSAQLDADAVDTLDALAEHLEDNVRLHVTIEGHCDERGTEAYNLSLGHARAEAIKRYLVGLGVDGERVSTVSYGEERPVTAGRDRHSLAQNRRGEFVLFGEGEATAAIPSS